MEDAKEIGGASYKFANCQVAATESQHSVPSAQHVGLCCAVCGQGGYR